ncbi:MAG: CHAT domain-containing protein [Myxococcota bacterium]
MTGVLLLLGLLGVGVPAHGSERPDAGDAIDDEPDDVPEAEALHAQLRQHFADGEYGRALEIAQDLLARRQRGLGPDNPNISASLSDIATLTGRMGDMPGAVVAYTKALAFRERVMGADHPDVGALLALRSTTLFRLGRLDEAHADLERAQKIVPVTDRRYASILQNFGAIALARGQGEQATRLFERALGLRLEADGPEHRLSLTVAGMWASATLQYRPLVEGCAASRDVLRWALERWGDAHPSTAAAWGLRGQCLRQKARLAEAEAMFQRAVDASRDDETGQREILQGDLATLELLRGDADAAIARMNTVLGPHAGFDSPVTRASARMVLGRALVAGDRDQEAYDALEQARQALTEQLGPDATTTLMAQRYQGRAALKLGRADAGILLEGALQTLRQRPGSVRADAPWQEVGTLYVAQGQVDRGLDVLEQGEMASIAYYGAENPATLLARVPRIEALLAVGRTAEARDPLIEAVSIFSQWTETAQAGLDTRQALAVSALGRRLSDLALKVLAEPGDDAQAWRVVLALKGGARRAVDARASSEARARASQAQWDRLTELRQAAARAVLEGRDDAALRAERDGIEQAIAKASAEPPAPPPSPAALQAALPRATALVDLVVVGGEEPRLVAFLVTRDDVHRVDLGPSDRIERAVKRLTSVLQTGGFDRGAVDQVRAQVGSMLIAPFGDRFEGFKHVWVVLDGPVAQIPLGVLPDQDGRFLVETRVLRVLEDPRDVLASPQATTATESVVVGGVNYGAGEGSSCVPGPFSALPGTEREAALVADSLGTSVLSGKAATVQALRERLPTARVAHLATHGFFADRCANDARLDALAVSGVALSGANEGSGGVLTGADLLDMDLRQTELVVLSACQSGSGRVEVGEGVLGLRWALHRSGVQSLVMAMYRVPDEPTVQLMDAFYRRWKPGKDPAVALSRAQRKLIRTQRKEGIYQPGEWSGFVVSGR